MKNKLIVLAILLGLFFPLIRNAYSETTPKPTSDISIISSRIEYEKNKYPIQYINDPRCEMDRSSGNIYCNDAYLCVDLKNNSQSVSWANIPLKVYYYDKNNFQILDAIVKTPDDNYVSQGEEKKFRILLDESEFPYSQKGDFSFKVTVSDKDIGSNKQDWRSLKVGMTQDEIRQILGEPTHIEDPASDSPEWVYGDYLGGGKVYFCTIGPLWNQKKLVVKKWEEPS